MAKVRYFLKNASPAFSDPGAWFHAVEYYRHALPFHVAKPDPAARDGVLRLAAIDCAVPLRDMYDKVDFEGATTEQDSSAQPR